MRGVLVFLADEGRDILGFSLGGVGVSCRDESKGILLIFSNSLSSIIDMRVGVFWALP